MQDAVQPDRSCCARLCPKLRADYPALGVSTHGVPYVRSPPMVVYALAWESKGSPRIRAYAKRDLCQVKVRRARRGGTRDTKRGQRKSKLSFSL